MFKSVLAPSELGRVREAKMDCLRARGRLKLVLGNRYDVSQLDGEVDRILARIFPEDGSFVPVGNERDAALLDRYLVEAIESGRLTVLHEHKFHDAYGQLYFNPFVGGNVVGSEDIYAASMPVLDDLFAYVTHESTPRRIAPENAHVAVVWRAAIEGLEPAYRAGFRKAIHYGMSRNGTARSSVYYRGPSALQKVTADQMAVGFDPVCATGGTMEDLIVQLESQGFLPGNIQLVSKFAAPEGLVKILRRRPDIRGITIGRTETGMDSHAYLFGMKVGDAGDLSKDASARRVQSIEQKGLIHGEEAARLMKRYTLGE